jgi:ketosteroid isomerase-like protein
MLAGCATTVPGTAAPSAGDLAARVAELEAREEIRAAIVDYGRFLDAGDFDGYVGLFASDGEWVGGFGAFAGRDAIRGMLEQYMPQGPFDRLSGLHLLSNERIEIEGETAHAVSKWFYITPNAEGRPGLVYAGRYDDAFVREGGRWLIKRRVAYGEIPFDDPLATEPETR